MKMKKIVSTLLGLSLLSNVVGLSVNAEDTPLKGDVNQDGVFNQADVIALQKWLSASPDVHIANWKVADFCEDDKLNIVDLSLMKKELLNHGVNFEYQTTTDQIFHPISWMNEQVGSLTAIRSTTELLDYLNSFFYQSTVQNYTAIYTEEYFEKNVLLLNTFYQSSGATPLLKVSDVFYQDGQLKVSGKWSIPEVTEDVMSMLLVQVTIPKNAYQDCPIVWETSQDVPEPDIPVTPPTPNVKQILVQNILQNPELPTGCECVSLTILLNHLGYFVDKVTLARDYLPKMDFYWYNGIYYGADFRTTFAGNPESEHSYGCYAPCIVTTANRFLSENGYIAEAVDLTGTDFDSLLSNYIDNDIPVLIWITSSNLHESRLTSIWTTPTGEQVQWRAYEHCVVLTGYDKDNGFIDVSDPLIGNTSYDYERIKQRYIEMGQQAVYIEK